MSVKIGINGFGRIGRLTARTILSAKNLNLVAINSLSDTASHAYLLKHDSVYGAFPQEIKSKENTLIVGKQNIMCFSEKEPSAIPWDQAGVDVVLECTGKFRTQALAAPHLSHGVKQIIMSSPAKDDTPTFIYGVNHTQFQAGVDTVVSNSSCTTNCIVTVLSVLDGVFGVTRGNMTTVHAVTDSQNLLDNSHKKSPRLRRSALQNWIPTTTGSARDLTKIFPHLKGKLPCRSIRIPSATVSLIDLVVEVKKKTDENAVNQAFENATKNNLKGILDVAQEELVSRDFIGSPYSAVIDPYLTDVIDETLIHVVAWYDNEWEYVQRLVDLARYIGNKI